MTSADVTAIRPGHEFDVDRLAYYLASHLEGVSGTLTARNSAVGSPIPLFWWRPATAGSCCAKSHRANCCPPRT